LFQTKQPSKRPTRKLDDVMIHLASSREGRAGEGGGQQRRLRENLNLK
jgi:hypothetical protein